MRSETVKFLQALAVLIGTIVGVGTFGIPYAFSRAGFFIGLGYLGVLSLVVLTLHLIYGEIVLRTHEKHRLIGYAEIYLGTWGKRVASLLMIFGIFGTLLAYTIVGGTFSKLLFDHFFVLGIGTWSILFFAVMAFFVITDFKTGAPAEVAMSAVLLTIFVAIIGRALPDISFSNLSMPSTFHDIFLPYGVILFSLAGGAAVPELRDILAGDGKMKRIITIGTLIPALLYALFALSVVGAFGNTTATDSISSLASRYGSWMSIAGGLVGILTVATSFIVMGLVLKHAFIYDLKMRRSVAILTVLTVPLVLFAVSTHDFVKVISFVGGVLGGVEGVLLLKLHRAARAKGQRQPEYSLRMPLGVYYVLGTVFAAGIVYEIVFTIG
ncbi:MAG: aromatic amino acid transport family protein [bacterium]|nr:aromatic amino acid transport family protein [bacterium]